MKRGTMLGPYRIESELGAGGMGTVYRATVGDAVVALRVVHPHLLATNDAVARLRREIEIGKSIRHPNVVATLDGGEASSRMHFAMHLAMELVEGQTLQALGSERTTVLLVLWKATGEREHLDAAKQQLDEALAQVPVSMHAQMLEHVPTNREIAAAANAGQ